MITFDYSIIRYMPNQKRGEIVNIGIIVFTGPEVDVHLLNGAAKLRVLDGQSSINDLISYEQILHEAKSITKDKNEFIKFLSLFGKSVKISAPAQFNIDHAGQYDAQINKLFNELVKPFASREPITKTSRIQTLVKNKLDSLNLLAKSADELSYHKVVQNYPISKNSGFSADFLLKNGKFHISEVIDYNVNDINAKFKETTLKVMTFMEGKKHLGNDVGCYFVYSASSAIEKEISAHLNLANDYSEALFNLASKRDESSYFEMISNLAGRDSPVFH